MEISVDNFLKQLKVIKMVTLVERMILMRKKMVEIVR